MTSVPYVWPTALSLGAGAMRCWIQVARTGRWKSKRYGRFSITRQDLEQMLGNFMTVTPIAPTQLPIDYDHLAMDPKRPGDGVAAGWITRLELRGSDGELWAEVEWTPDAAAKIRRCEYRYVSPSFIKDYVWKNGKNIGTTLVAAAITNHPFLEGMAAITLATGLDELAIPLATGRRDSMKLGFLTQMCARFSPQQVSHAVERGCGCVRARESAVKSSIAQSTAACAGPAFGGGPARRQPVPPQGAEALAFTGRRTMNTRGTRPGLSPTFYRWAEPSLTVQPLGTGRPLAISAVYRGPDFPRACSSSPDTDGVLQPRKSMTMLDLLAMEPAKAAPIPERNRNSDSASRSATIRSSAE